LFALRLLYIVCAIGDTTLRKQFYWILCLFSTLLILACDVPDVIDVASAGDPNCKFNLNKFDRCNADEYCNENDECEPLSERCEGTEYYRTVCKIGDPECDRAKPEGINGFGYCLKNYRCIESTCYRL
jgi:hypothetical protein